MKRENKLKIKIKIEIIKNKKENEKRNLNDRAQHWPGLGHGPRISRPRCAPRNSDVMPHRIIVQLCYATHGILDDSRLYQSHGRHTIRKKKATQI